MATRTRAYLSLGTNLGDRMANLERGVRELAEAADIAVVQVSPVYETAPLGPGDLVDTSQPAHLNCAVLVETTLSALALLAATQRIERIMGRGEHRRWEPRVIDIDIVLFGGERITTPELTVPHASMCTRAFVLRPLVDLDADLSVEGVGRLDVLLPNLLRQKCERIGQRVTIPAPRPDPGRSGPSPRAAPS